MTPPLLVDNERVDVLLARVVSSFKVDAALRDDLMQEARLHLWLLQNDRPGQSLSWYLRSCRFRLQHYLAAGRSIDSRKRYGSQHLLPVGQFDSCESLAELQGDNQTFNEACLHDLMRTLAIPLKPLELEVLQCLAEGLPTTDIAKRLNLSSPTVTKYRRKIARLAVKMGITSPASPRRPWKVRRSPNTNTPRSARQLGRPKFSKLLEVSFGATHLPWHKPVTGPVLTVDPAA